MMGWDFNFIKNIMDSTVGGRPTYIVTDDKEDFLERMEGIGKRGLKQDGDNLKCLEILSAVQAVRNGEDIFKAFPILNDWNEK